MSYLPTWTCELFINGTGYGTNTSVLNGTGAFIVANHSLTSDDYYNWYVNCTDIVGSRIESATNWLIYDTTKPNLALQTTTPNGTVTPNTSVSMNLTIGPENGPTYSFINWNNSLVGWWRFDNESPLIDWSSSGNAGTAKGNANQTVAGKFGEAYAFDGDGDYVDLGSDPQFDYENLTVCAWVKPASTASNQRIVAGGASNTNKWLLGRSGTGFVVANGSASGQNAWSVSAYASGEWYHVCMLRNPVKLYVNGIDDTGATSGTWSYGGSAKIGARDSSAGFFNGSIDEVIIFNRTLNSTEIGALYNSSQYALNASFSSLADANYTYRAYTVDSAGNVNSTGLFGMQVDTTTPFYNMVEAMPNTTADVDPGVLINVTVNVSTVRMSVSSVTLEYKSSVDLGYTNKTMYLDTDGLYRSNFTTDSSERTYIYRIWSNNSIGEANYSNTATLLSFWDHTWTIDRSDFGSVLGFIGNISVVGGILINNTGDDTMLFTMTALNYPLPVYFNGTANSKCFTLDGKNATGFDVTAQFSSITGTQTTLTINTTATYGAGVSSPPYNTTTATLITYTGGPYLDASISGYNATVVQGMTAYFNSTVTNLGNETANQTWINWSLASGMSNSSGLLELAAGSMSSGAGSHSNVTVYVDPASVSAGAASITLKANCTNCTEATASVSMAILCSGSSDGVCGSGCTYKSSATNYDPDCPAPSTTVVTQPGGGGTVLAGGGALTREQSARLFKTSQEEFELVRGTDNYFTITISNPLDQVITNVTVDISGYMSTRLSLDVRALGALQPGESRNVTVYIDAPEYLAPGRNELVFAISGRTRVKGIQADFSETRTVILLIQGISRTEAVQYLDGTQSLVEQFTSLGFPTGPIEDLYSESLAQLGIRNYDTVKLLNEEASKILEDARAANSTMAENTRLMAQAEHDGIPTPNTMRLNNLAVAAFQRGEFALARSRAEEATMTYALETKGEFNFGMFIYNNLPQVSVTSLASLMAFLFIFFRIKLGFVKHGLKLLDKEEVIILGLIKQVQKDCFEKAKMSMEEYMQATLQYEDRLGKAVQKRVELESRKVYLSRWWRRNETLYGERDNLLELIKGTQSAYMEHGTIETHIYERRMLSLRERLSEVEEKIATKEAREAIKKRMRGRLLRRQAA